MGLVQVSCLYRVPILLIVLWQYTSNVAQTIDQGASNTKIMVLITREYTNLNTVLPVP